MEPWPLGVSALWDAPQHAAWVALWWRLLTLVSVLNVALWAWFAARAIPEASPWSGRRVQAALSAGYTFGCAFRALLPRADVQRICLVDSWLSSVAVGRSVATVAELCFAAQLALVLRELSTRGGDRLTNALSAAVLPLLALAELCSWYAVLTTDYLGNTLEQSLWTATGALVTTALFRTALSTGGPMRTRLAALSLTGAGFVSFMSLVDVPMYLARWRQGRGTAARTLHWLEGLRDASTRWVVTFRWEDWSEEVPWMSLYFSCAVWVSISLIAPLPGVAAERPGEPDGAPRPTP